MPLPPITGDVFSLQVCGHDQGGNFVENVHHFRRAATGGPSAYADATSLLANWQTNCQADYLACMGDDYRLDFVSARRIGTPGGPSANVTVALNGTGGTPSASAGLGGDIALIVGDEAHPGHIYMPCAPQGGIVGDVMDAGYVAALAAYVADLQGLGGIGFEFQLCVVHRKTGDFSVVTDAEVRVKPTLLNKRTLPLI